MPWYNFCTTAVSRFATPQDQSSQEYLQMVEEFFLHLFFLHLPRQFVKESRAGMLDPLL
jgi:hypothetical protein